MHEPSPNNVFTNLMKSVIGNENKKDLGKVNFNKKHIYLKKTTTLKRLNKT